MCSDSRWRGWGGKYLGILLWLRFAAIGDVGIPYHDVGCPNLHVACACYAMGRFRGGTVARAKCQGRLTWMHWLRPASPSYQRLDVYSIPLRIEPCYLSSGQLRYVTTQSVVVCPQVLDLMLDSSVSIEIYLSRKFHLNFSRAATPQSMNCRLQ